MTTTTCTYLYELDPMGSSSTVVQGTECTTVGTVGIQNDAQSIALGIFLFLVVAFGMTVFFGKKKR